MGDADEQQCSIAALMLKRWQGSSVFLQLQQEFRVLKNVVHWDISHFLDEMDSAWVGYACWENYT